MPFAVGLKPIAHWLAPDTEAHALAEKLALMDARLGEVFAQTPGSEPACQEVADMLGAPDFLEAGRRVSDDLCIMEKRDGAWVLSAALLCAPSHWRLEDNIGGPLSHLHGPVPDQLGPDGGQGLAPRISRMFDALAADNVLERFNWTIQAGPERFAPSSVPLVARAKAARDEAAASLLHLRVERQTMRKLPRTGAVAFTIRVCIDPLVDALRVEGAEAAFVKAWRTAPDYVRAYKNWPAYDRLVEALLRDSSWR